MSFIDDTVNIFGGAELGFQAVMFGQKAIYIEGAKPVKIDSSEMVFRTKKFIFTLVGDGLEVKELSSDCISIIGKIHSFTVDDI